MATEDSYVDYDTFTDPEFSQISFANALILATNDPSDTPLDLSTPLSRVLFDVQEVDTHIDALTTKSALPLLQYTQDRASASTKILDEVEAQVASLTEGYNRLQKDVIERYQAADQVRLAAERLVQTLRLGRSIARCLQYGRQLEGQMNELDASAKDNKRDGHKAIVPAAYTLLSFRQLFAATGPGEEGEALDKVTVIATLRNDLINPSERAVLSRAQQTVREFSMSSLLASNAPPGQTTHPNTYAQTEDTKYRTTSALTALYLLSPAKPGQSSTSLEPILLISALQSYLQTALTSSLASLSRALATLPTLDRTLLEISARCQNIVALEALLSSTKAPDTSSDFLQPLLHSLDTSSLPSFFWRSLASSLTGRVQDIINRGGVSARTLRTNRDKVASAVRECVNRGSRLPAAGLGGATVGNWEREAAVMVGSIVGVLGR
ncbi:Conserved oligomeric Golgi complex subunit [Taxawa tesnikishii (nom. ined.)]|nr:Conserved oligomeric Golgi complex subunit [Dothideales sp. JES 119]